MTRKVLDMTEGTESVPTKTSNNLVNALFDRKTHALSVKTSTYDNDKTHHRENVLVFFCCWFRRGHAIIPGLSAILTGAEGSPQRMMGINGRSALWDNV